MHVYAYLKKKTTTTRKKKQLKKTQHKQVVLKKITKTDTHIKKKRKN